MPLRRYKGQEELRDHLREEGTYHNTVKSTDGDARKRKKYAKELWDAVVGTSEVDLTDPKDINAMLDARDELPVENISILPEYATLSESQGQIFSGTGVDLDADEAFICHVQEMLDGAEDTCMKYANMDKERAKFWEGLHRHRWVVASLTVYLPCAMQCLKAVSFSTICQGLMR